MPVLPHVTGGLPLIFGNLKRQRRPKTLPIRIDASRCPGHMNRGGHPHASRRDDELRTPFGIRTRRQQLPRPALIHKDDFRIPQRLTVKEHAQRELLTGAYGKRIHLGNNFQRQADDPIVPPIIFVSHIDQRLRATRKHFAPRLVRFPQSRTLGDDGLKSFFAQIGFEMMRVYLISRP